MATRESEHVVTRFGWVIVLRGSNGFEFISYGPVTHEILGRGFWRTRKEARKHLRELREHDLRGYVSRATVTLQRHR